VSFIVGFIAGLALGYGLATLLAKSMDGSLEQLVAEARAQRA
jgi:hypothetical protein